MNYIDNFILIVLPYLALATFLIGSIYRYRSRKFQVSSLSSQFLEGRKLFYGSVPFHWGVLFIFCGHLIAFLVPRTVLAWNSQPVRLLILEISAFIFGISMLVGLVNLFIRRYTTPRLYPVTNKMDFVVYVLLILQTFTGLWIAYNFRWGSSWFSTLLSPYLNSIFKLNPDITAVVLLPWTVKLHIAGAFIIIGILPFSRLIHMLVLPLNYIWRPYQQVMWYWDRKKVRNRKTPWSLQRPKNT
ncbi:MAG: respiratory nitrate reductase subunit gamma [Chitinophagaceae bacterium]|jgi:nitrate reductase gamma subunit|nr:respiratory nitrate reductase subunit gamma [Chitinophagaceae bacterium]MBP6046110.1 respiratory nitrate reductase subunit gamma [Ferruginibacter sp.]MBK7088535.1 respiratory nitrate reductase subunit gamma [Chitinophagaceae bacterium]MBK7345572.1 respiratory nitrate reductase subunit gamma [Chitinophagaceae bacterium]MBK7734938.1 respiratory nitrate reductase subunit gamma [Chitinophagaceae bacterium]